MSSLSTVAANRIREIRLRRAADVPAAFSVEAVARRLGVSWNTVRRWESGEMRPRKRHARALARALGVSVDELGLEEGPEAAEPPP